VRRRHGIGHGADIWRHADGRGARHPGGRSCASYCRSYTSNGATALRKAHAGQQSKHHSANQYSFHTWSSDTFFCSAASQAHWAGSVSIIPISVEMCTARANLTCGK
jgi:hypothetical protein